MVAGRQLGRIHRWGIIGTGNIASKFAADLFHVPGAQLTAIASRSMDNARAFADSFQAPLAFDDHKAMLASDEIDLVYVATPHPLHQDQAVAAIENGKPVLVEKPLAMNAGEVDRIIAARDEHQVFAMEAMWSRFLPAIQRAKAIIDSGQLGTITKAEATLHFHRPFDASHRLFDPALGGGVLLDLGVYPISLATMLLGAPRLNDAALLMAPTGIERSAVLEMQCGGVPVHVSTAFEESPTGDGENTFCIWGDKGTLRVDRHFLRADRLTVWDRPMETVPASTGNLFTKLRHKLGVNGGRVERFERATTGLNFQAAAMQAALARGQIEHPTMPLGESRQVLQIIEEALAKGRRKPD